MFSRFLSKNVRFLHSRYASSLEIGHYDSCMFSGINNGKKLAFAVTPFERNMIIDSLTKEEVKMAFRDLEQFSDTPGAIDTQLLA